MNVRCFPANANVSMTINGRSYNTNNAYLDVPDFDAAVLCANGWTFFGRHTGLMGIGPTASRPAPGNGINSYYDTDLGELITFVYDWPRVGSNGRWVDSTGTTV